MHHCLTKDELRQLIDMKADGLEIESDELRIRIEHADIWQDEVGALTYLLSQILERRAKEGLDCATFIRTFYEFPEVMSFRIQEFDFEFVEYMLANIRDRRISLEEELIGLQDRLREHDYGRTLRY